MKARSVSPIPSWVRKHIQLVAFGAFAYAYFLGVVSWNWYAIQERLGYIDVSTVQYVSIGIFALACLTLVLGTYLLLAIILERQVVPEIDFQAPRDWVFLIFAQLTLVFGSSLCGLFVAQSLGRTFQALTIEQSNMVLTAIFLAVLPATIEVILCVMRLRTERSRIKVEPPRSRKGQRQGRIFTSPGRVAASASMWSLMILLLFSSSFLPAIAQEFGGARPRSAYLDVDTSQLSAKTLAILLPDAAKNGTSHHGSQTEDIDHGVHRSIRVDVLFVGPNYYLVERPKGTEEGPALRLSADVVRFVEWDS